MNIEKMREEFKAWESEADDGPQTDPMWLMFDPVLNQFALVEIQSRWEAWQASRESLVIELPKSSEFPPVDFPGFVIERCSYSIRKTGAKTK